MGVKGSPVSGGFVLECTVCGIDASGPWRVSQAVALPNSDAGKHTRARLTPTISFTARSARSLQLLQRLWSASLGRRPRTVALQHPRGHVVSMTDHWGPFITSPVRCTG